MKTSGQAARDFLSFFWCDLNAQKARSMPEDCECIYR